LNGGRRPACLARQRSLGSQERAGQIEKCVPDVLPLLR
jgi:hypothetical protein